LDVAMETNAGTLPGVGGALPGFEQGARLMLTLPTGERTGFTFRPVAETIGSVTFYRPAWVADSANGWTLQSVDRQLRKVGGAYFDVETGLAYNPASPVHGNGDEVLERPEGPTDVIDSGNGTVEFRSAAGMLLVGDGGVTALGGAALQFLRDAAGRVVQVTGPGGSATVYEYDDAGRLTAVRDLATGAGVRYGYVDGRLAIEIPSDGEGRRIDYAADGSVTTSVVRDDLGSAAAFTGKPFAGTLPAAGGSDSYAFTVRASEIAGMESGALILRVATTGDAIPEIAGLTAIASSVSGGQRVTLFALREAGLHELIVTGAGAYGVEMRIAGDINGDGKVDGVDSAAVIAALAGADVDGDGVVDATDTQLVAANYGFRANQAPVIADAIDAVKTHVDLSAWIDLGKVATDPDGDRLYYRIVGVTGGSAVLTADGRSVVFTPDAGYSGAAAIRISADDGFGTSAEGVIDIAGSDARLVAIDFDLRRVRFAEEGGVAPIMVIGQFEDQADVYLPLSYLNVTVANPGVVRWGDDG